MTDGKEPWMGDHIERLVRVETRIQHLGKVNEEISRDLREVRDAIRGATGGWKLIVAGASIAAAVATIGNFLWRSH